MASSGNPGDSPGGLPFLKMHGLGNDYVFVDARSEDVPDPPGLARFVSDRHFGVGSDGLVLILPHPLHHAAMRIFNADGSEAEMCGNALRCIARYLWERGEVPDREARIQTATRTVQARILLEDGGFAGVEANLGRASFAAEEIPLSGSEPAEWIDRPLETSQGALPATAVSVGNPHLVIFDGRLQADEPFQRLGPELERHPLFPAGTNVEFVDPTDPTRLVVRVWERGSGPTLGCGSGACAVLAAAHRTGRAGTAATIVLPGGELQIRIDRDGHVWMAGPAEIVFRGVLNRSA